MFPQKAKSVILVAESTINFISRTPLSDNWSDISWKESYQFTTSFHYVFDVPSLNFVRMTSMTFAIRTYLPPDSVLTATILFNIQKHSNVYELIDWKVQDGLGWMILYLNLFDAQSSSSQHIRKVIKRHCPLYIGRNDLEDYTGLPCFV